MNEYARKGNDYFDLFSSPTKHSTSDNSGEEG